MANKRLFETPNGTIDLTLDDTTPAIVTANFEEPVDLGLRSRLRSGLRERINRDDSSSTPISAASRVSVPTKRTGSSLRRFLNASTDLESVTPSSSPDVVFIGTSASTRQQPASSEPDSPQKKFRKSSPSKKQLPSQKEGHSGRSSLDGGVISCPICFDSRDKVIKSGRHWSSTICGHVYCNECIESAIVAQGCCPNCRKKLTKRSVHPLYL